MFYTIRITNNNQFTDQQLIEFTRKHSRLVLIQEYKNYEIRTGEHFQGWIEADITIDCIRKWVKNELNSKGNKDFSITQQRELTRHSGTDGYRRYCCKGRIEGEPPQVFYNITSIDVLELHANFYKARKEYIEEIKKSKETTREKLLKYFKMKYLVNDLNGQKPSNNDIITCILRFAYENKHMFTDNMILNYYYFLLTEIGSEKDYIESRRLNLLNKLNIN